LAIPSSQLSDEEYKILTKARDEAHRFANKYREKQMAMERK
jgi:excinuclease UvrABC nuclease subunit